MKEKSTKTKTWGKTKRPPKMGGGYNGGGTIAKSGGVKKKAKISGGIVT